MGAMDPALLQAFETAFLQRLRLRFRYRDAKGRQTNREVEPQAMLILSAIGEHLVAPVFAHTDAIGTVMRRKLEPITQPLLQQIAILRGAG